MASDQQMQGLRATLVFDRDTASRLGITPSTIDQTLYDAYGQRQVSTMFTQLNQYHVVLEVKPGFQQNPLDLRDLYHPHGHRRHQRQRRRAWCPAELRRRRFLRDRPTPRGAAPPACHRDRHRDVSVERGVQRPCGIDSAVFPNGGQVPLSAFSHMEQTSAFPSPSIIRASFRWSRSPSIWRPTRRWATP